MRGYYYHLTYLERPITAICSDNPETSSFSVDEVLYQGRKVRKLVDIEMIARGVLISIEMKIFRS